MILADYHRYVVTDITVLGISYLFGSLALIQLCRYCRILFSIVVNIIVLIGVNLVLTFLSKGLLVYYSELVVYGILSFCFF